MFSGNQKHLVNFRKAKLIFFDLIVILLSVIAVFCTDFNFGVHLSFFEGFIQFVIVSFSIILCRFIFKSYNQVWRYSRPDSYLKLILADFFAAIIYCLIELVLPTDKTFFSEGKTLLASKILVVIFSMAGSLLIRFLYIRIFELSGTNEKVKKFLLKKNIFSRFCRSLLYFLTGFSVEKDAMAKTIPEANKIRIAIIGAGTIGALLAEELLNNKNSVYVPVCFIDNDKTKVGRNLFGIEIIAGDEKVKEHLISFSVQEVVFTINRLDSNARKEFYERYSSMGFKVKVYTYPIENSVESGKRQIREFDPEELLFRQQVNFLTDEIRAFYHNKVVLISGGGGSIGSELGRQIAKMGPKQLVLLDIFENNVYDIQQEMKLTYGNSLNLAVEIASVRDEAQLDKVFRTYRPEIVLHAAAHKHVPLMEHNCSEAVKNNVFGTLNIVNVSEKYGVEKFIMISTDKAVNPTNVMGASKRLCEMIVGSRAAIANKADLAESGAGTSTAKAFGTSTSFSSVRFGNVLGSSGSVIPLFKRQIANGGPITITDKRIIRYFMTIPEASQLVLTSGAMAKSGELFVLDMGRPVKILDLAENMIRLSGLEPYKDIDIKEIGLRPGEKLYEELLMKTETLSKTDNKMIFIEKDDPLTEEQITEKLNILSDALEKEDDEIIKSALKKVVPTFISPEDVNNKVGE